MYQLKPCTKVHSFGLAYWNNKKNRHHVHLTESVAVAKAVGSRYGKIVLLEIDADRMHKKGYKFFKTENNVWLVESVPYNFISKI